MGGAFLPWLLLLAFFIVVMLEMFLPSAGILFIASVVLAISAVVFAFFQSMLMGVVMMCIIVFSIPVLIAIFGYVWPHTPIGKRLSIKAPASDEVLPESLTRNPLLELKGQAGTVTIPMLPTGEIQIEGKRYPATCQSGAGEVGQQMRVVEVRMGRLFVLPVEIADDHQAEGGFEEGLDQAVENTSFEDFEWDGDKD